MNTERTYEEWRKTHPPMMGGSEAAAPPAAENNGDPAADQPTTDPWTETLEGVDEVYRPHVEQAIGGLREQFTPRLELADRLEPLGDYSEDLLALLDLADDDGNALQDFLGFASMASQVDEENPDAPANQAFAEWFYGIGEKLGLIDPEEDDGEDGDGETDDEGTEPNAEVEELRGIISQLQQRVEQAESAPRVQAEQQRIDTEVAKAIQANGLKDDEQTKNTILRFARDYVEQPNMVELAVKDLLTLTGGAQRDLLGEGETETVAAGASPGNGSPDTRPEDILTGNPTETRKRAHAAALSRLQG